MVPRGPDEETEAGEGKGPARPQAKGSRHLCFCPDPVPRLPQWASLTSHSSSVPTPAALPSPSLHTQIPVGLPDWLPTLLTKGLPSPRTGLCTSGRVRGLSAPGPAS